MQRLSKTLVVAALVVLLASLVGFAGTMEARTKIIYWNTYTDHHQEALEKIIAGFNASQDKYEVVSQQQPYSEFDSKLMQSVRIGMGPDIVNMFPSDAINYISQGLLVDLAPFINNPEYGIPGYKDSLPAGTFAEITQWGGDSIYLFPLTLVGEVLFYNKTLFDKYGFDAPKTWTELEEISKVIYANEGIPGFGTDSVTDTYQCLIMQAGSGYIDAAAKALVIDEAIAKEKLNWFANGVKAGYFRLVGEDYYFSNPFGSQAVASYIGSSAGVDYVKAATGDSFEIGYAPIPQEGSVKYISQWSSNLVCLSKDEEHARGAYEFMKYLISQDVLVDWAIAFGAVPAHKYAVETERFQEFAQKNEAVKALLEEIQYVGMLASIPGSANVRTEIDRMVQSVALGVMDADTAYTAFVRASQAALNE